MKVGQEIAARDIRKYKPSLSDHVNFEEGSSLQYAKYFDSSTVPMFQELEKSTKVQSFLLNLVQQ